MKFDGVLTALVTPFKKGRLDTVSLKRLVRDQLSAGIDGFVVNGTTAESPCLTTSEVERIYKTVKAECGKTVPLVLGVGSNSTAKTIDNLKLAHRLKADAVLVVTPYYNKPPQRGLVEHFRAVAKASRVPVILYNVPGRTVISMSPDTVVQLSKNRNIVGIKEASGDMSQMQEIKKRVSRNFLMSSGDDATCMQFAKLGGHGVISVISHLIPDKMVEILDSCRQGENIGLTEYKKFDQLNKLMGIEPNPIPVKMGLYLKGIIDSPELRLPLVTLSKESQSLLLKEMTKLELV